MTRASSIAGVAVEQAALVGYCGDGLVYLWCYLLAKDMRYRILTHPQTSPCLPAAYLPRYLASYCRYYGEKNVAAGTPTARLDHLLGPLTLPATRLWLATVSGGYGLCPGRCETATPTPAIVPSACDLSPSTLLFTSQHTYTLLLHKCAIVLLSVFRFVSSTSTSHPLLLLLHHQ